MCGVAGSYGRGPSPLAFIDACAAAGSSTYLPGSDDGTATATLPFTFQFYSNPYTAVGISSNGVLGFPTVSGQYTNFPLRYPTMGEAIFAFWDDLYQRTGICAATVGTAPNRRYVVEWNDV
jgi:hypothetical protein